MTQHFSIQHLSTQHLLHSTFFTQHLLTQHFSTQHLLYSTFFTRHLFLHGTFQHSTFCTAPFYTAPFLHSTFFAQHLVYTAPFYTALLTRNSFAQHILHSTFYVAPFARPTTTQDCPVACCYSDSCRSLKPARCIDATLSCTAGLVAWRSGSETRQGTAHRSCLPQLISGCGVANACGK